jgi:organic radical activating enzyme
MNPTVTISVWNFCQNSCPYCVSGSNSCYWKWEPRREIPDSEITPIGPAIEWIKRYRPGAAVHISGGEPLIRPDIVKCVSDVVEAGFDTTIFTNGLALRERTELLDMPVKWYVSYHQDCGTSIDKWLKIVDPIRDRRHVLHTIIATKEHLKWSFQNRDKFRSWNFVEKWDKVPNRVLPNDYRLNPNELNDIASNRLTLICHHGIYPCNNVRSGTIGSLKDLSFDIEKARSLDAESKKCVLRGACAAWTSAALIETI